MAAEFCGGPNQNAPNAIAGPTALPAALTKPPAERPNAAGSPQELRENTRAASADHCKSRFIAPTIHIPNAESSGGTDC